MRKGWRTGVRQLARYLLRTYLRAVSLYEPPNKRLLRCDDVSVKHRGMPAIPGEVGLNQEDTANGDYFWSDHEADDELARLRLIEQFNDPSTCRQLDQLVLLRAGDVLRSALGLGRWRVGFLSGLDPLEQSWPPTSMCGFLAISMHKTSRSVVVTSLKIPLSRRRTILCTPEIY